MKLPFYLLFPVLLSLSCAAQNNETAASTGYGVMFYNLENLYDTINDPNKDDEVFLPDADRKWDAPKYAAKLENLSKVIATGADMLPTLVGLCEVENESVVKDLVNTTNLKPGNYNYVHFDSPDERGIDVALLYNKNDFKVKSSTAIAVTLPGDTQDFTRDILLVSGELMMNGKKEMVHVFVNHWPSRSEGEEVSAPKRAAAAARLKQAVDSLNEKYTNPNIIIMGDFNDTPFDASIQKILNAQSTSTAYENETLINLMAVLQATGQGSYNYKGNWQALDQIIVSSSLLDNKTLDVDVATAQFVKKEWMMYHNDKYGDSPDRTFAGIKYIGGYSDHLPVFVGFVIK
jgi:Endonuclease/Exonuclease/phosphatase family